MFQAQELEGTGTPQGEPGADFVASDVLAVEVIERAPLCVPQSIIARSSVARSPAPRSGAPCQTKNNSPQSVPVPSHWPVISDADAHFAEFAPRSVWACLRNEWTLLVAAKDGSGRTAFPFKCRSWRCPKCRFDVARVDFARILGAFTDPALGKRDWLLLTLTFDPSKFSDQWEAYRGACKAFQKLRQRLSRRYGHSRSKPAQIRYVAVWERHASGWPHAHIAIDCPELTFDVRAKGLCVEAIDGCKPYRFVNTRDGKKLRVPNYAWKRRVLDELGQKSGFGIVSDVRFPRRDEGGVAGYFAKLSSELVGMFDQRPVNAPKGFRRLRGSRKTLPPRHKGDGSKTGALYQRDSAHVERFLEAWEAQGCSALRLLSVESNLWLSIRLRRARSVQSSTNGAASRSTSKRARPEHPPPQASPPSGPVQLLFPT